MNRLTTGLAVISLLGLPLLAGTPSDNPRVLGPVILKDLAVQDGKVTFRVPSGGCTDKASIRPRVQKETGLAGGKTPHYVVTFERVKADDCKAMLLEGVVLEYDVAKDLEITGPHTLTVTNGVSLRPQAPAAEDLSLNRGLLAATVRALEMELKGYEERLKTAEKGVGPAENVERYKARIAQVKGWLETYRTMNPADYALPGPGEAPVPELDTLKKFGPETPPQRKTVRATLTGACAEGSTLEVEGMTKSGPFFHVAGIAGGDYGRLEVGKSYDLTLYLVYRREYVGMFPSYLVYIADVR